MNITIGNIIYSYEKVGYDYIFEKDIQINGWTICKHIRNINPRSSIYKWDLDACLEFEIVDPENESKSKRWFYFRQEYGLHIVKQVEDNVYRIKRFLEDSIIFNCASWTDYENQAFVLGIKIIIESEANYKSKRDQIEHFIKHQNY